MKPIPVALRAIVDNLDLPTVIKTAILPGDNVERLFIATQTGEIFFTGDQYLESFINLQDSVLALGQTRGGYDERGLLGLAFHPEFTNNGLFYVHYSVANTQGPGALSNKFEPDPCDPSSWQLVWNMRANNYDHIDVIEEWRYTGNNQSAMTKTLLRLRRPFMNHNGVNTLNFSPETGHLIFDNGDGGSAYDPFNMSQNNMEIAGKAIGIQLALHPGILADTIVSRFDELSDPVLNSMYLMIKGIRNSCGVVFTKHNDTYLKFIGNVGQDVVESIFTFPSNPQFPLLPLTKNKGNANPINLGWRGWEGDLPTTIVRQCNESNSLIKTIAYYQEAIALAPVRIVPLTSYYQYDNRPDVIEGQSLVAYQPYRGTAIRGLKDNIVFAEFSKQVPPNTPQRGALGCTPMIKYHCQNEYRQITIDHDFGNQPAVFTCLGTNQDQTRLFLGVYGSTRVANRGLGTIYEIVAANQAS